MISVVNQNGVLIKTIPTVVSQVFGLHKQYGFISATGAYQRYQRRVLHGLKLGFSCDESSWLCQFKLVEEKNGNAFDVQPIQGCTARKINEKAGPESYWEIIAGLEKFHLKPEATPHQNRVNDIHDPESYRATYWFTLIALIMFGIFYWIPFPKDDVPVAEKPVEPMTVKILPEETVVVPKFQSETLPKELEKVTQDKKMKRAILQDLGFLKLLGKKELTKAIGGMPLNAKDVSPGAGPGGKEGSGGEVLQGLGEGVKKVTVGNTGVVGLGGIGTKGVGGGAGGYGTAMVGSGEGKRLTTIPLNEDLELEGGLDRFVIQATIAKYLSQIRACYEDGLSKSPGISGQVSVQFEIGGSGSVNSSRVSRSTLGNAGVESCINQRVLTWKFPKPLGGVNVKVNYPFLLRPVNS